MQITVQFQGASKHFSNPAAVNASFAAQDGTSANINISVAAEKELVLGAMYEIHIIPIQPLPFEIDPAQEHKNQLMEENN